MASVTRRAFAALPAVLGVATSRLAHAAGRVRIGYQKNGSLVIVRQQGRLEASGLAVEWVEFPSGPPMLEALAAGAVDFGATGDTPPIFAQAAGADLLYVGAQPVSGASSAILVHTDSPIRRLEDLRGKRLAFTRGSSAHNVVVKLLARAGLSFADIQPVNLQPPEAGAAFRAGAIDAWSIWDPFFAIAEIKQKARPLPIDPKATIQNSFFLANRGFVAAHADLVSGINEEVAKATAWAALHRDEVAQLWSEASGVDIAAQQRAVARAEFGFGPMTEEVVRQQQVVADRFQHLGLIPAPINVRDIVWLWKPDA
jgi:aliphatic sulfonates family ABC transporter substrate-binding protein